MKRVILFLLIMFMCGPAFAGSAGDIVKESGVKGGLIVHFNCGDGKRTAELRINDSYIVHGLDTNKESIEKAREHIKKLGIYGKISVDSFDGKELPYSDNLVNLLVSEDAGKVSMDEIMRVLAPNGAAYIKPGGKWKKTIKPWPKEIDEWTHHLYSAGGNPISSDQIVAPPEHLQWTAGPLWARSHGWTPSVSAMVSASGRLFYICDETLTGLDGAVPNKWYLVARDAFSGVALWKYPIEKWGSEEFSGTPDSGRPVSVGRFTMPPNTGKRLVAVGDTVYVTPGPTAPVTAIEAATGKVKRVYKGTERTDEILCTDGRLILSIVPSEKNEDSAPLKEICAVDIKTGKILWKKDRFPGIVATRTQDPSGRLELIAGEDKVFALTTEDIVCMDAETGAILWRNKRPALPDEADRRLGFAGMYEYQLSVLVYYRGVVLLAQPEPNIHHTYHTMPGTLYAFAADDGKQMWKHAYGAWGHGTQPDVFGIGDTVWTHVYADTEFGFVWGKGYKAKDSSVVDYRIQQLDLRSGELRQELATKDLFNVGHHHRCYRNKSTERFLMASRRGVEFVDLETGKNYQNHWVRSGCLLGNLPCNGMIYVTPHPCGCYITAKLTGFNALAPARDSGAEVKRQLLKGPEFKQIQNAKRKKELSNNDWATYRGNPNRSGSTDQAIGTDLKVSWKSNINTRCGALVVANGKVLVAGAQDHTVYALAAEDGKMIWNYTAGGRVDSPPTMYNGLAIFGSTDGRVYCLNSSNGELAWRFEAAPYRRLVTAFNQLESPWPVHGSVLIHEDKCWFAAGRSSYIDGGIILYALDPVTGEAAHRQTFCDMGTSIPETEGHLMQGLLNDIPSTDGSNIFIRQMNVTSPDNSPAEHFYTSGGYLDSSWFNRTFWQIGNAKTTGLMVLGEDVAYGIEAFNAKSRDVLLTPGEGNYKLKCIPIKTSGTKSKSSQKDLWQQNLSIRVTAMLKAGDVIYVAGPPDIVEEDDPHGAWEGRKGGVLCAYSCSNGKKLAEYKLDAPPAWDGMAAAGGKLYVSQIDGNVICLSGK